MKLEDVLAEFKNGKKIRRYTKKDSVYTIHEYLSLTTEDILAGDWEVVKDPIVKRMRCSLAYIREHYGQLATGIGIPIDTHGDTRFKITVEEIIKENV